MKTQLELILKVIFTFILAGCVETSPALTPQSAVVQSSPTLTATVTPPPPTPLSTPVPPHTHTPTPSATYTPIPPATPTPLPTSPAAVAAETCPALPEGGFLTLWQSQPDLRAALGCPFEPHPRQTPAAWPVQTSYQPFERGALLWSSHLGWYAQPVIYALYENGTYQRFDDTFDPAVDPAGGEQDVTGRVEPALGFGKVWREQPALQERLGWPTTSEQNGEGHIQMFNGGEMIWLSQTNRTYVFLAGPGEVKVFEVPFSPNEN